MKEVYTKVIRSAIVYRASAYYLPTPPKSDPKGITKQLAVKQSDCLRAVARAYRATLV